MKGQFYMTNIVTKELKFDNELNQFDEMYDIYESSNNFEEIWHI